MADLITGPFSRPTNESGPFSYSYKPYSYKPDTKTSSHTKSATNRTDTKSANNRINTKSATKRRVKSTATKRIGKFMKTHRTKITARFLSHVCAKSGECMMFGKESGKIQKFFNNFTSFEYSTKPIRRLSVRSVNGIVVVVPYSREKYKASALLKMSQSIETDNLWYEYIVGVFINTYVPKFPCFLITHGVYLVSTDIRDRIDDPTNEVVLSTSVADLTLLTDNKQLDHLITDVKTVKIACTNSAHIGVLIQYFQNSITLSDFYKNQVGVKQEMYGILYQIYGPLASMHNVFTHYDLHAKNVMLVEMPNDTYIKYHYHPADSNDATVTFNSVYLVKIIDYGRCYFNDGVHPSNGIFSSNDVNIALKKHRECDDSSYLGFWFRKVGNYNILASKRNHSADLLVARLMLRNDVMYNRMSHIPNDFTVNELPSVPNSQKINNVIDMRNALYEELIKPTANNNVIATSKNKLGDLHVYECGTRDAEWIPN